MKAGVAISITGKPKPQKAHLSICAAGGAHRIRIEEANGPTSESVCVKCGRTRHYCNSMAETPFSENHGWRE